MDVNEYNVNEYKASACGLRKPSDQPARILLAVGFSYLQTEIMVSVLYHNNISRVQHFKIAAKLHPLIRADQRLCYQPEDALDPWLQRACPANTLIRLRGCTG